MGLSRVPQIDRPALAAEGFLPAPVSIDDLAVQDPARSLLGQGALQRLLQARRASREHFDHLIQVPVRRRLCQPETPAKPRDIAFVPGPGQREQRLPACLQQPSLRVPFRAPISRRRAASRPETNRTSSPGTPGMTRWETTRSLSR